MFCVRNTAVIYYVGLKPKETEARKVFLALIE